MYLENITEAAVPTYDPRLFYVNPLEAIFCACILFAIIGACAFATGGHGISDC